MCLPVVAAMAVAGAATNIIGQQQARKTASSVEEARRIEQENMITETRRRATDDYLNQTRLEQDQQSQEEASVAVKGMDLTRQMQKTVATGDASAAERGVAGRTVEEIAQDYHFQADQETGRLKLNQELTNQQHAEAKRGYATQYSQRIADVRPYIKQPLKPVDYFGPVFGVGSQIATADVAISQANPNANTITNALSRK